MKNTILVIDVLQRLFSGQDHELVQPCNIMMPFPISGKSEVAVLPDGWDEDEQGLVDAFFGEKVPQALAKRQDIVNMFGSCSASDCDRFARWLLEAPVHRSTNQGCNSYTLVCPERNKIVQFRMEELNTQLIDTAKRTWGDLVAQVSFHGGFSLPVYTCNILPGQLHSSLNIDLSNFPLEREKQTVIDIGKFVAKAIHHSPKALSTTQKTSIEDMLHRLEQNTSLKRMNPEVHAEITKCHSKLHLLDRVPEVFTHPDLVSRNIFVDNTGALTGVIGLEATSNQVFGSNIFALWECYFGNMDDGVWRLYDMPAGHNYPGKSVYDVLAAAFWEALVGGVSPVLTMEEHHEAVGVALGVGVVKRYFWGGMLDVIDLEESGQRRSMEYARGILLHLGDINYDN